MSSLRTMIFCGYSPRHYYVANRLCRASYPQAVVVEAGTEVTFGKLVHQIRTGALWRKGWRWLRDRRRYYGNGEAAFFFGEIEPRLEREDLTVRVPNINHPGVRQLVKQHRPDLILVFGTSLIKAPLLGNGRLGMVNLHGGLSPEYRGADCTFWALYNGEPEKVGCTLHYIDAGIDTGRLIAHICPEVHEGDDELTLFWRAVRDGAEVYAEMLHRLEQGETLAQAQGRRGHLYRVRDRLWRHERELARRMGEGMLRDVRLPARVSWFPATQPAAGTGTASSGDSSIRD